MPSAQKMDYNNVLSVPSTYNFNIRVAITRGQSGTMVRYHNSVQNLPQKPNTDKQSFIMHKIALSVIG